MSDYEGIEDTLFIPLTARVNISKMFASLKKKLVIADAFLTGYELNILRCKKENC